jgi:hypothetical protein
VPAKHVILIIANSTPLGCNISRLNNARHVLHQVMFVEHSIAGFVEDSNTCPHAGSDVNSVARSSIGSPVNEPNAEGTDCEIFPTWKPRPPTAYESCDRVAGAHVIATVDDFSFVKLFNGPAVADDAPFRAYRGHASHVMCVRFSTDDRRLFSVGGTDRCVFQWRTVGVNVEDQGADDHILRALDEAVFRKYQVLQPFALSGASAL